MMHLNLKLLANQTASPEQALEILGIISPNKNLSDPLLTALIRLLGNSNFLARWGRRYPERVQEILTQKVQSPYSLEQYLAELRSSAKTNREELAKQLIEFKYRHLFRIALRDFGNLAPLPALLKEWSDLARAILQMALECHQAQLKLEFGTPSKKKATSEPIPFAILALGKLGGDELNYSSDIDLQYFYETDEGSILQGSKKQEITPHEYFSKLSEKLSSFFQQKREDGFLYRVDLELRPEGKSGPITNSLDALEVYYESFGASWERQAMIKATCAAGDLKLVQEFQNRLTPFTYPRTADFSFIEQLAAMKEKIIQQILIKFTGSFHVKLGDGGIREIEFFVQALQHLFGGKIEELRTSNTLQAIQQLENHQLISPQEQTALSQAYIFLRNLENRLQLIEEQQTHLLPIDAEEIQQLARRMGYSQEISAATEQFTKDLEQHRKQVKSIFNDLLNTRFKNGVKS